MKQIKKNEIYYWENNNKICNISKSSLSPFIMISKDLLFVSGKNKISIININYCELIREI